MRMLLAFSCAALVAAATPAGAAADRKPNVIVFLADDLGYGQVGFQGCKDIPTPNIDAIAKNGVRCTQGYVSGPYCSPTRAGLMTGRYQQRFGHEFNEGGVPNREAFGLPTSEKTVADRLKGLGYATAAVGKWHLGYSPQFRPMERGFDEFYGTLGNTPYYHPQLLDSRVSPDPKRVDDPEFYTTDAYAKRAVEWVEKNKEKPFFLYFPFNAVHAPLQAPKEYLDRFESIQDPKRKSFAAMMSAMDDAIGDVMSKVREAGLEEDTIVVFLGDNGGPTLQTTSSNVPLRGVKATTLEGGVRVPFAIQWKGKLPAGSTYNKPVIQLDLLPTFVAAAGGEVDPSWKIDGVNLLPYLEGKEKGAPHEALYWRFGNQWAVRKGDLKLVSSRIDGPQARLFDLSKDIAEESDLAAEKPEQVEALKKAYDEWNSKNIAPLWVPPNPPGDAATKKANAAAKKAARKKAQTQDN